MNNSVTIRGMREEDLPFANSVRAIANWNQTQTDWQRLLTLNPEGCFVAEWNGSPAGTATTTRFGPNLAWIGMLLVHPQFRRRGIARALLQACVDHLADIPCVKLDATPLGKPLYDQFGFRDEYALARWERLPTPESPAQEPRRDSSLLQVLDRDLLKSIATLDTQTFGAPRMPLLETLLDAQTVRALCDLSGYALLRQGSRALYVGPVVAQSAEIAERLITALDLRPSGGPYFWDIPDGNHAATRLATILNFTKQRPFIRMVRGTNTAAGTPSQCFGIVDPSLG